MKNPVLRWAVWIGGGLLAAAMIGAGGLFYLVSRLDVRGEIERVVEQATGRDLTIEGAVGVSYWPVLGLRAEQAWLANVEGGRAPALARMDEIDIGVEIAPLFRREVVVRNLVLVRPVISLELDAQGQPNWLLRPVGGAPPTTPTPAEPTPFSLRMVRTVDAQVSFFDGRSNATWSMSEGNLRTAFAGMDSPVQVQGSLVYGGERVGVSLDVAEPGAVISGRGTPINVKLDGPLIEADFEGQTTAAAGAISGTISASGPSLRRLAEWFGAPIRGGYGLENYSVAGALAIEGGRMGFSNATFTLDALNGRGDFELSELRGRPYVSGRVELFDANFNPYLTGQAPAPVAAADGAAQPAATVEAPAQEPARALDVQAPASEQPIDFSALQAINADLEITAHQMQVQQIKIDGALFSFVLNDGFMAATLHRLQLYGGSGRGVIRIDAREPVVNIEQEFTFDGVDAQRFLTDAANLSSIEGRAELTLNLRTRGRSQSELIAGADGRAHIEVVSGALRGVDLGGVSRTISNALSGDLISPNARTAFQGFSATFAVSDGVLASDSLSFNTPDLTIRGLGVIDLPQRRLDVRLAPRSPRGGVVIPFAIRGPLGALTYDSDIRDRALREIQTRVRSVEAAARAAPAN